MRGVEAPGTADWEAVCADARKTPPQGVRGVSRNPLRTAGPAPPETHESLISRKTVAEVPLTGLSFDLRRLAWAGSPRGGEFLTCRVHEKHDFLSFSLGRPPSAGVGVASMRRGRGRDLPVAASF
jgi:hypothetical protein